MVTTLDKPKPIPLEYSEKEGRKKRVIVNKDRFVELLTELKKIEDIESLRGGIREIKQTLFHPKNDNFFLLNIDPNGEVVNLRKDILFEELGQIEEARTLERARYYLDRLKKSAEKIRTTKINDVNLNRWKEYDEIITDSLWVLGRRDTSGAHLGWYWGNFIPQIPHQMMLRYTKKGEWVLDPFVGSGTTLIECKRLGRNGIGIELYPRIIEEAQKLVDMEQNPSRVITKIRPGDSRTIKREDVFKDLPIDRVQLLIMHPPYHDIIKFGDKPNDLSKAPSVQAFRKMFGEVIDHTYDWLEDDRYLAVVIGDKYSRGEWIPLGFYVMEEVLKRGYKLKSIIVKNFEETRGKREQKELWRYRALVTGFYIFKHEYILLFKKTGERK